MFRLCPDCHSVWTQTHSSQGKQILQKRLTDHQNIYYILSMQLLYMNKPRALLPEQFTDLRLVDYLCFRNNVHVVQFLYHLQQTTECMILKLNQTGSITF